MWTGIKEKAGQAKDNCGTRSYLYLSTGACERNGINAKAETERVTLQGTSGKVTENAGRQSRPLTREGDTVGCKRSVRRSKRLGGLDCLSQMQR